MRTEAFQQTPDQQPNIADADLQLTAAERFLNKRETFQHIDEVKCTPLRVAAIGFVVVHALSKAFRHPEYIDQL